MWQHKTTKLCVITITKNRQGLEVYKHKNINLISYNKSMRIKLKTELDADVALPFAS